MNELTITEEDFMNMKPKEQMRVLFKNQSETLKYVQNTQNMVKQYKFHQKILYTFYGILLGGFVWIVKLLQPVFK